MSSVKRGPTPEGPRLPRLLVGALWVGMLAVVGMSGAAQLGLIELSSVDSVYCDPSTQRCRIVPSSPSVGPPAVPLAPAAEADACAKGKDEQDAVRDPCTEGHGRETALEKHRRNERRKEARADRKKGEKPDRESHQPRGKEKREGGPRAGGGGQHGHGAKADGGGADGVSRGGGSGGGRDKHGG